MSHFVVLVTRTDEEPLEEQLEPFYEQGEEGDYFMEKEYYLERDEKEVEDWIRQEIDTYESRINNRDTSEDNKDWFKQELRKLKRINKMQSLDEKMKALQKYEGGGLDEEGLYWLNNPNAKWDWWVEGGRWNKWLVKKDGTRCNRCLVGEIDFDGMKRAEIEDHSKYYDKEIVKAKEEERKPFFYGFENTPTKEEWVAKFKPWISPYAVLHEGEWMGKGEMGWWGIDDPNCSDEEWEEKFQDFIKELAPQTEITVVDCHI